MRRLDFSTPRAKNMAYFTSTYGNEGCYFTLGQVQKLGRFYHFEADSFLDSKLKSLLVKGSGNPTVSHAYGDLSNLHRHVAHDGQRLMAAMADMKLLIPGEDPVKTLIQLAAVASSGDIDPEDYDWAHKEEVPVEYVIKRNGLYLSKYNEIYNPTDGSRFDLQEFSELSESIRFADLGDVQSVLDNSPKVPGTCIRVIAPEDEYEEEYDLALPT